MNDFARIVGQLGFPVACAAFLLYVQAAQYKVLSEEMRKQTRLLDRIADRLRVEEEGDNASKSK